MLNPVSGLLNNKDTLLTLLGNGCIKSFHRQEGTMNRRDISINKRLHRQNIIVCFINSDFKHRKP